MTTCGHATRFACERALIDLTTRAIDEGHVVTISHCVFNRWLGGVGHHADVGEPVSIAIAVPAHKDPGSVFPPREPRREVKQARFNRVDAPALAVRNASRIG